MKLFFLLIFLSSLSFSCNSFSTKAQIRAISNGQVGNRNLNAAVSVKPLDISKVDFRNFTYPDLFAGKAEKTFTLKNGQFRINQRVYTVRKTYYFDITGDRKDEAITQIIAEGCGEDCDSHSLFYVHTFENNKLKLIWKIATGAEALGGLKSVAFKDKQIILETFGNCAVQNSLISASFDAKNPKKIIPTNYTRFVFSMTENIFTPTTKDILPFQEKTIAGYRAQIIFGEQE